MKILELSNIETRTVALDQLEQIGQLRYQAYRSCEAIPKSKDEIFLDKYDMLSNCINFSAHYEGQMIGAIRGVVYDPTNPVCKIPAFEVYYDEIQQTIGLEKSIYESSRFVVDAEFRKGFHANLALIKTNCLSAYSLGIDNAISCVREKHKSFYEKMGFVQISAPKVYPGLTIKMILMYAANTCQKIEEYKTNFKPLTLSLEEIENYSQCLSLSH